MTPPTSGTQAFFSVECIVTLRSSTSAVTSCSLLNGGGSSAGIANTAVVVGAASPIIISTGSGQNVDLMAEINSSSNSFNFNTAFIEVVKP